MMVFQFMRTITFYALWSLNSIYEGSMSPLSTILILGYSWIHVYFLNCGNEAFYIEAPIDKALSLISTLNILYVKPYNGYVRLWRYLDNS